MKLKTQLTRNYETQQRLRRNFTAMSAYIKNTERAQINDLMLYLELLGKQKRVKPKISRRKEIVKIMAKKTKIETK
jgi:hypothetical protein